MMSELACTENHDWVTSLELNRALVSMSGRISIDMTLQSCSFHL